MAVTRADIQTAARAYLHELGSTYVTGTTMANAVKRANRRLNTDSQYNRGDVTVNIKSGVREYTLTSTTMEIYEVRLGTGTDRTRLEPTSRAELTRRNGDWEGGATGTPDEYYTEGKYIGFDPRPKVRTKWTRSNGYTVGQYVIPSGSENGFVYKCTVAGTSAGTVANEPTWPTTIDGTTGEGPSSPRLQWKQDDSHYVYLRSLLTVSDPTASESITWCPSRYTDTIAKLAACEIAQGFMAEDGGSPPRYQSLYQEYLQEARELKQLGSGRRSKEMQGRFTVTGYSTYRR